MKTSKILTFLILSLFFTSCFTTSTVTNMSLKINPGMTKSEVLEIMGTPVNRQFKTGENGVVYEALQWDCGWHRGMSSDFSNKDMLIVYFADKKVTDLNTYVAYYGQILKINWETRPDFVIERRDR